MSENPGRFHVNPTDAEIREVWHRMAGGWASGDDFIRSYEQLGVPAPDLAVARENRQAEA